ncbi:MAG TPA: hypothetical protein G4O20_00730 [Dehalococcoidia bacterium]|nr:hypothetical protein [Dehalococcoidia bacterium]
MEDSSRFKQQSAHNEDISSEFRQLVLKNAQELGRESGVYLCQIDKDCPQGFTCVKGLCVPAEVK